MIYREVFAGKSVHITHLDRRLGHIKSTRKSGQELDVKEFWRQECIEYQYWDEELQVDSDKDCQGDTLPQDSRGFTSLLKTCRKVYVIQPLIILYDE